MSTGDVEYIRKSDAHRIALHYGGDVCAQKIAELPALRPRKACEDYASEKIRRLYGYDFRDLIVFAEMCRRNGVREEDLQKAANNIELAFTTRLKILQEEYDEQMKANAVSVTWRCRFGYDFEGRTEEDDERGTDGSVRRAGSDLRDLRLDYTELRKRETT